MGSLLSESKDKKAQIKLEDKFENIKSKYIFKKIFNNLDTKRKLNLIRLNKNIKKRLDININDYIKCLEIVIELKPVNNKSGRFININEENEKYYHISFNNGKKRTKRNYINEDEQIENIKIIIDYQIKSLDFLFHNCDLIESINFKQFYRNNINNMSYMFSGCSSLKKLNLNNFNTHNVTNMGGMFSGCSSLKELYLNNFNTNNVTDMYGMFLGCSSLKELNLNNFNTNNVTDMYDIFRGCSNDLIMKIKTQYKNIKERVFKY